MRFDLSIVEVDATNGRRMFQGVPVIPSADDEIVDEVDGAERHLRVIRRRFNFAEESCHVLVECKKLDTPPWG